MASHAIKPGASMSATQRIFFVLLVLCGPFAARADESRLRWQREDIAAFRERFLAADRSFTATARAAAEERLSRLELASEPLSPSAFAVELCRIAALSDNGHTQCLPSGAGRDICRHVVAIAGDRPPWCQLQKPDSEVADFAAVPIAFHPFGEEFHVIGVEAKHSDLLGARLVAVERRPVASIRGVLRSFAGGTLAHRDQRAAEVLASPEQLHAVGLSRGDDSVLYEFVAPDGRRAERRFAVLRPAAAPDSWRGLPAADRLPWAFREPQRPFRYRDAPEIDSIVVQLRQNADAADENIAGFLEKAEAQREALGRKHVVLDMRFNGGGNFLLTRDFMLRWPARVPGRFFVLTSRRTFSAAIAGIAYLKQAGGGRVSIVGEPVGDRLMFFSDGLPIQLPHSGQFFLPAVVRMDYRNGCRTYGDCHEAIAQPGRPTAISPLPTRPPVVRMPVAVDTLVPDVHAPWTIDSWLSGADPMMEAVAALLSPNVEARPPASAE